VPKLAGRTVVVTRAPEQAGDLVALLRAEGAEVLVLPVIAIHPPVDSASLDRALGELARRAYDLVAFASKNAVLRFVERAEQDPAAGRALRSVRVACVGEKTAAVAAELGLGGSGLVIPKEYRAEALVEAIGEALSPAEPRNLARRRILLPRAEEGRAELVQELSGRGATVDAVTIYVAGPAAVPSPEALLSLRRADAITFLSGKSVEFFLQIVPEGRALLAGLEVAVIGPIAAEAAARLGVRVDIVPPKATAEALVVALVAALSAG
jgi:uroporphyrinogen III methyltransferase/synthase